MSVPDDPKPSWSDTQTEVQRGPATPTDALRFEDQGEIAVGGTSSIRHVFDRRIRRHLAMKVLDPQIAAWPEAARLLAEEAQITGQLDHPNIVPVHDLGVTVDGLPMFVMKLVAGRTLTELIKEDVLSVTRKVTIFLRICDAVSFAHSRGVIHRDLKPDNVMIGSHGQVYVMDWGCAQLLGEQAPLGDFDDDDFGGKTRAFQPPVELDGGTSRVIDGEGTVIGTGAYLAPEQAWGRTHEIDERTDVFLLGGVLYHMLAGQPPFPGKTHLEAVQLAQAGHVPPPTSPHAPRELCRIAMKALSTDRTRRYASVDLMQAEVERFLLGGAQFETRVFPAGTVVIREGDAADAAYIVTAGTCEAFRTEHGRRVSLRRMGPGDVFGETALLTEGPRTASVIALDELTAQVIARESLDDQLRGGSWLGTLVKVLAERFRDLDARLAESRRKP